VPLHVDDTDLPSLPPLVSGDDLVHRFLRSNPLLEQVEQIVAVLQPGPPLRRDRADPRPNPRNRIADTRTSRRDHDTGLTGLWIDRDDREGVEFDLVSPLGWFLSGGGG
jgi:hypothetical protein